MRWHRNERAIEYMNKMRKRRMMEPEDSTRSIISVVIPAAGVTRIRYVSERNRCVCANVVPLFAQDSQYCSGKLFELSTFKSNLSCAACEKEELNRNVNGTTMHTHTTQVYIGGILVVCEVSVGPQDHSDSQNLCSTIVYCAGKPRAKQRLLLCR